MRIDIPNFTANLTDEMRSAGYHYDGLDEKTKELRFYRSLSDNLYPRFHIYGAFDRAKKMLFLNLHLDQKAPVYQGSTAHAGDYDGEVLDKEASRLKRHFMRQNLPKIKLDL